MRRTEQAGHREGYIDEAERNRRGLNGRVHCALMQWLVGGEGAEGRRWQMMCGVWAIWEDLTDEGRHMTMEAGRARKYWRRIDSLQAWRTWACLERGRRWREDGVRLFRLMTKRRLWCRRCDEEGFMSSRARGRREKAEMLAKEQERQANERALQHMSQGKVILKRGRQGQRKRKVKWGLGEADGDGAGGVMEEGAGREGDESVRQGDESVREGDESVREGGEAGREGCESGREGGESGREGGESGREGGESRREGGGDAVEVRDKPPLRNRQRSSASRASSAATVEATVGGEGRRARWRGGRRRGGGQWRGRQVKAQSVGAGLTEAGREGHWEVRGREEKVTVSLWDECSDARIEWGFLQAMLVKD